MNIKKRRATTIDAVDSIPTKRGKTKKTTKNSLSNHISEMNNSNPETETPTIIKSVIENETANSQNSNAAENEDSTQPLFSGDVSEILAQTDLLLTQMDAYMLETSAHQNNSMQQHSSEETEQEPSTSMANNETPSTTSHEQSPNRKLTAENTNQSVNDSLQSLGSANQSQYDDSVILIGDGEMPRPCRSDEDVIFVDEYVKAPPRVTGVVDLCHEDEDESVKKNKLMAAPTPSIQTALTAHLLTLPVASTSALTDVKCPVCLDSVPNNEVHSTICGHLFCGPCITFTIQARKKCPMCNRKLNAKQHHRIYFHN